MRYLLYCVFAASDREKPEPLVGVGGRPVFTLSHNGLGAAVSRVSLEDLTPTVSRALAYGKVVETFHGASTVIPVRYGCQFEDKCEVIRFLAERNEEYHALLNELNGCVEMGIRIFPKGGRSTDEDAEIVFSNPAPNVLRSADPGQLYLAARKAHYARQEQLAKESDALIERCRGAFRGLFVKCKTERRSFGLRNSPFRDALVSVYFLVQRQFVEPFRRTFRHIDSKESARLLMSGPWPPYSFVEAAPRRSATPLEEQIQNR